ncbi:MAG: hypothetical protein K0Q94_477 [Paenibacillus sp.]|nr:hypothetical protein [Paenibacillus sp.]
MIRSSVMAICGLIAKKRRIRAFIMICPTYYLWESPSYRVLYRSLKPRTVVVESSYSPTRISTLIIQKTHKVLLKIREEICVFFITRTFSVASRKPSYTVWYRALCFAAAQGLRRKRLFPCQPRQSDACEHRGAERDAAFVRIEARAVQPRGQFWLFLRPGAKPEEAALGKR